MDGTIGRRVRQLGLVLGTLLMVVFAPLMSTSSYAAVSTGADGAGSVDPVVINVGATMPVSTQFDLTGFLQVATLGGAGTGAGVGALQGGSLVVNNHTVIVPSNTIVILPASALTWQELFAQAPAPYGIPGNPGVTTLTPSTGLALADVPAPISTYEVHVVGNRVGNTYIAGMVNLSQQDLNSGAGYINFIDYDVGPNHDAELRVGGILNDPNCAAAVAPAVNAVAGGPLCSGARVRINDPLNAAVGTGRYGRPSSPDIRFTVDQDNPTIAASTGFPMCISRSLVDPAGAAPIVPEPDSLCPQSNRPLDPTQPGGFALSTATLVAGAVIPGYIPDATQQAPIEVGDYVSYAGTEMNDSPTPTAAVAGATTYISAHTITDNFAAYTRPGVNPAYVSIETSLIGTGGLTVVGAGEAVIRTRFEGMTTDPTRNVHIYGIDINPATGLLIDRDWGMVSPDPGPPNGAVMGRWRIRPPCTGTAGTVSDKICTPPAKGQYLSPPREMRAVVDGTTSNVSPVAVPGSPAGFTAPIILSTPPNPLIDSPTYANGIVAGQYHAPLDEYIFPENVPGSPVVPNNFEAIDFLVCGGYTSATGVAAAGRLDPWPGAVAPVCGATAPVLATAGNFAVASGGTTPALGATLVSGTTPVTYAWTAPSGTFSNPTILNPTYTAPANLAANTTVTLTLTATNVAGSATATVTVLISSRTAPTVTLNPNTGPLTFTVTSGQVLAGGFKIPIIATDPAVAVSTFTITQTPANALGGLTIAGQAPLGATSRTGTIQFNSPAPTLPVAQVTNTVITLNVTARNRNNVNSPVTPIQVIIKPAPDTIAITTALYRVSKQRLELTATSSVIAPSVVLTLKPYLTAQGTTFDPATLGGNTFTNTGGGIYTLTLVGAPQPAADATVPGIGLSTQPVSPVVVSPLTVVSNHNGVSPATPLSQIRAN